MIGGPCLTVSIMWLGWTGAYASIPWFVPMLALLLMYAEPLACDVADRAGALA